MVLRPLVRSKREAADCYLPVVEYVHVPSDSEIVITLTFP
jgi:hypothetical protein